MHSSSGPEKRGALFQLKSPTSVQVTGSFCCCSHCFTSRPLPSLAMGRSHSCAPPKSTEATAMPPLRPHCIAPGTKTALTPTSHLQPPSTTTPAAPRNTPRHERPQLGCRFGRPAQGSPDVGACVWLPGLRCSELLMCLQAETWVSSLFHHSPLYPTRRAPKCLFFSSLAGTLTSRCAQLG